MTRALRSAGISRRLLLSGLAVAFAWTLAGDAAAQSPVQFGRSKVVVTTAQGPETFTVEVARSVDQRSLGLMNRPTLAPDRGMLFDFEQVQPVSMWMKNTLISLDMIFIAADGRIVNIAENTKPQSLATINSAGPVLGVLEVAGGTAKRLGIRVGDQVRHGMFGNAPPD